MPNDLGNVLRAIPLYLGPRASCSYLGEVQPSFDILKNLQYIISVFSALIVQKVFSHIIMRVF